MFDFSVVGLPFRLWRQFATAFILTFALAAGIVVIGRYWSRSFASDFYSLGNIVFLASLLFDAYWFAALKGASPRDILHLPRKPLFWKFILLCGALDVAAPYVVFVLKYMTSDFHLQDLAFNPFRQWLSLFSTSSFDGIDRTNPLVDKDAALGLTFTAVIVALTWTRFRLCLWPTKLMLTEEVGQIEAARQLTKTYDTDLAMVYFGVAVLSGCVGIAVTSIAWLLLGLSTGSLLFFAFVLGFACLFRAAINSIYAEHVIRLLELPVALGEPANYSAKKAGGIHPVERANRG